MHGDDNIEIINIQGDLPRNEQLKLGIESILYNIIIT